MTDILIGTSGWNYPGGRGTWNGLFYPARRPRGFDELAYYAERFDTVEVNGTFYRQPEPAQTAAWVARTPKGFQFAVKLYQKFTHPDMYLARDGVRDWDVSIDDLDVFRAGLEPLARAHKLASLLIQFPASFHAEPDTHGYLDWLLDHLREYPLAVELRHQSWDAEEHAKATAALLAEYHATRVIGDEPFHRAARHLDLPPEDVATVYLRLHGRNTRTWWAHEKSEDRYNYLYSPAELEPFAEAAREASEKKKRVLLYMNNHFSAKSVANAVILKQQLGQPIPADYPPALVDRYPELQGIVATSGLPLGS